MIKVAALTSGQNVPSTRFRVRQHINSLQELGIKVDEYFPQINKSEALPEWGRSIPQKYQKVARGYMTTAKILSRLPGLLGSWTHQVTWLQRELITGKFILEPLLKKPIVFDVDDAIWTTYHLGEKTQKLYTQRVLQSITSIAKQVDLIVTGNSYLAEWFADYNSEIRIIPTAIDTERFKPNPTHPNHTKQKFIIGWTGTSGNFPYLRAIEPYLKQFMTEFSDSELLIMADQPPSFTLLPSERVIYRPWSAEQEHLAVQEMTVGLMPLTDDEWTKGKCSFKMLQYMACGRPVIVSSVGMNKEVLNLGQLGIGIEKEVDWYDALRMFYKDRDLAQAYGKVGREVIEQHFSQSQVAQQLAQVFRKLSG
ncbi:MAG: glycosyltransferase family 4 protein [Microcystaceae cyanobacterium]